MIFSFQIQFEPPAKVAVPRLLLGVRLVSRRRSRRRHLDVVLEGEEIVGQFPVVDFDVAFGQRLELLENLDPREGRPVLRLDHGNKIILMSLNIESINCPLMV